MSDARGRAPVRGGEVTNMVRAWRDGAAAGAELHEYLGWSWEQYDRWVYDGVAPDSTGPPLDDLAALTDAYHLRAELASSPERRERLASSALTWALDAVQEAVEDEDPSGVLALLDALITAPGADLYTLGAGPVEDVLHKDPARWDEPLAQRCAADERWRVAVYAAIWPDGSRWPQLGRYLRSNEG